MAINITAPELRELKPRIVVLGVGGAGGNAINNMIDEIKKPVDPEINGSARKAELQSIKQTATDCKELIVERQRLEQMIKDLKTNGEIEEAKDYSGGFAERFSK